MNQPSVKGKLNQVVSSKQKSASTFVLIDNLLVLVIGGRDDIYLYNYIYIYITFLKTINLPGI